MEGFKRKVVVFPWIRRQEPLSQFRTYEIISGLLLSIDTIKKRQTLFIIHIARQILQDRYHLVRPTVLFLPSKRT